MRLVPHAEALSETAVVYCDDAEFRGRADSLIAAIQRMSQLGQTRHFDCEPTTSDLPQ
jgi:hypothetical protein